MAVSFLLLIGAGLLINSFLHLRKLDPGYRADHLLTMKVVLSETKYPDKERRAPFFRELIRRVQNLPGVESVAVASNLPLTYNGDSMPIGIEGRPILRRTKCRMSFCEWSVPAISRPWGFRWCRDAISRIRTNRMLVRVAVITEKTARHFWPGENPIGKRFKPGLVTGDSPWREVIGVVKDVRQNDFAAEPKMQMYMAHEQVGSFVPNAVVVRTSVDPLSLSSAVRKTVWEMDKDQPVSDIRSMEEIVSTAVARQRFSMLLLGVFASLALVLAAVGIYGVMSYSVAQRTREIGIRMALGAQRSDVLKMAVGQGFKLVLIGVAIGLAAAFVLTRVMASLLFGVSATDPVTFVTISLVLMSVAVLASYIPALRASRIDPMEALRHQ